MAELTDTMKMLEEQVRTLLEEVEKTSDVTEKKKKLDEERLRLEDEKRNQEAKLKEFEVELEGLTAQLEKADDDVMIDELKAKIEATKNIKDALQQETNYLVEQLGKVTTIISELQDVKLESSVKSVKEDQQPEGSVKSLKEGQKPEGSVKSLKEGLKPEGSVKSLKEGQKPESSLKSLKEGQKPEGSAKSLKDEKQTKKEVGESEEEEWDELEDVRSPVAAPALVDKGPPGGPPGPPPTPDGKHRGRPDEDFPLYDSAVLLELREADERAAKAAKAIEAVREQLTVYTKKDEMTDEDIKMMEQKQKELMEKMEEFEAITKKVQHLVGLVDVASSQLGPPQKNMVPLVEGVRTVGPSLQQPNPEDTLPKVIVCGTSDVDQVPKIIVCEPTKARDGKHPLYHQIQGKPQEGSTRGAAQDTSGKVGQSPIAGPGYPGGYPGGYPAASMGGGMGVPSGMQGSGMMGMQGPSMMGMQGPGMMGMQGPGMTGMQGPAMPGMQGPGMPGMQYAGMPGYPGVFGGPQGMMPGGIHVCQPCKPKKHKSHKKKEPCSPTCPDSCHELGEMLEATLNMTEKLAEDNTELEGSRYQLQEAVLDKEKQYEGLILQLDSIKMELKNVKNENQYLKSIVNKTNTGQGQGDQQGYPPIESGGKKQGGLCKKELQTMPICKAQAYKEMGLPIPRPDNRPPCPGAKFAASMGWNENQGCKNELSKSVNCSDMQGNSNAKIPGCACSTKGPGQCPIHAYANRPLMQGANTGAGDHGPNCPCGCLGQPPHCNKADMEAVVQTMEQEVKSLQKELELVQAERRGLALQKKLLNCMADVPAGGSSGVPMAANDKPPPTPNPNKPLILLQKSHAPENLSAVELQLNSLREQYRKLQEDYNIKVEEVAMVRVEYEAAKRDALALLEKSREAEARVDDLLERLRIIELEKTKMAGSKDQMMELEQQLTLAKQRYREGQEELEELKTTMQDQMLQLEEYRNKYLSAQQTVEEQRRQIDIMELENNRISEQVNLEIQRVKTQFQEKLQELTPLPDMLKATQLKLQECDQLRQLAERNVEQLLNQSDDLKEQNKKLETELDELKKNSATHNAERSNLASSLTTGEKKIEEIKSENSKLRATVARLEEVALNNDRRLDEKNHEVLQLQSQLETLREESARQVSRTKDRCEAVRRTLQNQISQLECQLAQSRAAARTAQKDRDEIRQRMQAQITSLNDNFEQAQLRIRSLQSHVNYLKSSYTNIFAPDHTIGPKPIDGWSS